VKSPTLLLAILLLGGCQTTQPAPVAATPPPAAAKCFPAADTLRSLLQEYGELPIGMGAAADGSMFILMTSQAGTWTLLRAPGDGTVCPMATGEAWEAVTITPKKKGTSL